MGLFKKKECSVCHTLTEFISEDVKVTVSYAELGGWGDYVLFIERRGGEGWFPIGKIPLTDVRKVHKLFDMAEKYVTTQWNTKT